MLVEPPGDHGVIVHFFDIVLIGPFIVFGLPFSYGFAVFFDVIIRVIGELQSMVVDASSFGDTKISGF